MAEQIFEGRVIQKIATAAEWSDSTLPLKKGEFAIVSDSTGKPINIRVGNGTLPFSGLVDMFDNIQQNVNFIKYNGGSALPTPTIDTGYTFVSEGSYTFGGSPAFTVPAGHWGTANWDGNSWSFTDLGLIPVDQATKVASTLNVIDLEGNYIPSFKNTKEFMLGTPNPNPNKYLFSPVVIDDNNIVGVKTSNTDSIKIPFSRLSRAVGLIEADKVYIAKSNEPVSKKIDGTLKLSVTEPAKENLYGIQKYLQISRIFDAVGTSAYLTANMLPNQESPFVGNINDAPFGGVLATNFLNGSVSGANGDRIVMTTLNTTSVSGRRFSFSIFVKGSKGQTTQIYVRRVTGATNTSRVEKLITFNGEWQRVSAPVFTGAADNVGLQFGFTKNNNTTADQFLFWCPQIEELATGETIATSPILFRPISSYQINFLTDPTTNNFPFSREVVAAGGYQIVSDIVRTPGGRSGRFYFQQDSGSNRRAELLSRVPASSNGMWYSWSTYFPASYIAASGQEIFTQWRDVEDSCDFGTRSPSFAFRTTQNDIFVRRAADARRCMPNAEAQYRPADDVIIANFQREVWHDFIVKIKWDYTGLNSICQIWHRIATDAEYVLLADFSGLPLGYNDEFLPVHKFGIYRPDNFVGSNVTSRTIYHSEVKAYEIDDAKVTIDMLKTDYYNLNDTKMIREASSINTTGLTVTDPVGDMGYFWAE